MGLITLLHLVGVLHGLQIIQSAPLSSYLVTSFTSPDPFLPFNNIAMNSITGDIYIGATERLYHLNPDLTLNQTETVEPCSYPYETVVNDNKLLVIAPSPYETLVTCWSCDEFCETRDLANISSNVIRHDDYDMQKVVLQDDVTTLGVVTWGSGYNRDGDGNKNADLYLFTGSSFSPRLMSLPVSKHNIFDLSGRQRSCFYDSQYDFKNDFKRIIAHEDYIFYFIERTSNNRQSSHIGRLCPNSLDRALDSYTEIEINCTRGTEVYSVIKSAHIGPAGSKLPDAIGVNHTDILVYAVFFYARRVHSLPSVCLKWMAFKRNLKALWMGVLKGIIQQELPMTSSLAVNVVQ